MSDRPQGGGGKRRNTNAQQRREEAEAEYQRAKLIYHEAYRTGVGAAA